MESPGILTGILTGLPVGTSTHLLLPSMQHALGLLFVPVFRVVRGAREDPAVLGDCPELSWLKARSEVSLKNGEKNNQLKILWLVLVTCYWLRLTEIKSIQHSISHFWVAVIYPLFQDESWCTTFHFETRFNYTFISYWEKHVHGRTLTAAVNISELILVIISVNHINSIMYCKKSSLFPRLLICFPTKGTSYN